MRYAKSKHLTRYDVLIIASMIEREAQLPRERPLVAAVIYNRLKQGMPLGIDATIRYYMNNWQRPIRVSELEADEPYNTRLNRGLPPTPIGNPGLASLQAAAHPAHKPYLFFVRKPGKCGAHAFSSTDAQFERDQARVPGSRARANDPARRVRVAGGPLALAAHAQRGAAGASGSTAGATSCCPLPPDLFAETVTALPRRRLPGRQRDDPAQGGGARAGRTRHRGGAGDRRGEHAHVRTRTASTPTTPTQRPPAARCPRSVYGARRSCSAPAAPPAPPSTRSAGGRGRPRVEPVPRPRRGAGRASSASTASGRARRGRSSTAPSVGLEDPESTFKALPLRADELGAGHLVVDLVYRHGGTLLLNTARAGGAEVVDGLEILVAQGQPHSSAGPAGRLPIRRCGRPSETSPHELPRPTQPPRPKRGNGITTPSRRGGSGRVLTDVIVDLGFVDRGTMDLAIERGNEYRLAAPSACSSTTAR